MAQKLAGSKEGRNRFGHKVVRTVKVKGPFLVIGYPSHGVPTKHTIIPPKGLDATGLRDWAYTYSRENRLAIDLYDRSGLPFYNDPIVNFAPDEE